jgi:hypothetical protein
MNGKKSDRNILLRAFTQIRKQYSRLQPRHVEQTWEKTSLELLKLLNYVKIQKA